MSINQLNNVISNAMEQVFEPESIAKTAIQCGYDIRASFQPGEFRSFCQDVEKIALKTIKESLQSEGLDDLQQPEALQQTINPLVEKNLRAICRCSKKDIDFPEPTNTLWDRLAAWIWK